MRQVFCQHKWIPVFSLSLSLIVLVITTVALQPQPSSQPVTIQAPTPTDSLATYTGGEIALSLDDAPMPGTCFLNGMQKTEKILASLKETQCPPIGIFAVGEYITASSSAYLLKIQPIAYCYYLSL